MYWIGDKSSIDHANELASSEVVGEPEYLDGKAVNWRRRVTKYWDVPIEIGDDKYVIQAYEGLEPEGVQLIESVVSSEDRE